MKTQCNYLMILLLLVVVLSSCDSENDDISDLNENESSESFFPIETGRYWKYDCIYRYGNIGTTAEEIEEYEVTVQIVGQQSQNIFEAKVFNDPRNTNMFTLTLKDNGDIYMDDKVMFSKNMSSIPPTGYRSFFNFPNIKNTSGWSEPGSTISVAQSSEVIETSYSGDQIKTGPGTDECEHKLKEKFELGKGLTYGLYQQNIESELWSNYYKSTVHSYTYNIWTYILTETGIGEIIEEEEVSYWQLVNNNSPSLAGAASFVIDDKAYIGTGDTGGGVFDDYSCVFYSYDTESESWSSIASLPSSAIARNKTTAFSANGKGYVCGGKKYLMSGTQFYLNDLWEYSPEIDNWIQKKSFPRGIIEGTGFSIGDKAYVGLGITEGYDETKSFYEYDSSSDSWSEINEFPGEARSGAVSFSMDGKGYVGLGSSFDKSSLQFIYYNDFWEYNPLTNDWTRLPDFPGEDREYPIGFGKNGYCYIGMGLPNNFYVFDANSQTWSEPILQNTLDARTDAFSFMIQDKIYYGSGLKGGNKYVFLSDFWKYEIY